MALDKASARATATSHTARLALACGLVALAGVAATTVPVRARAAQAPQGQNRPRAAAEGGDIKVLQVRENVFMLVGDGGNITVQTEPPKTEENHLAPYLEPRIGVLLVDTGLASMGDKAVAAIRALSKGQIRYVINTTADPAHTGGNEAIAKAFVPFGPPGGRGAGGEDGGGGNAAAGPTIFAHENVLDRMSTATGQNAVPMAAWPTSAYDTDKQVVFNGESIQIIHVPSAHTDGDSIVFFRRSDVISAGDVFSTESYPVIDAEQGGSVQGILDGLNRLLDIAIPGDRVEDGTLVIPGHGRLCDYADVNEYRNAVTIIRDRIQDMIIKGRTLEQVKAARPSKEYDRRYSTAASTTDMFVSAVYRDLTAKKRK